MFLALGLFLGTPVLRTYNPRMKPTFLKMLIVDDDALIGEMIKDYFKAEGIPYEFLAAGDGEEALKVCLEQKPDILITDIMIPKMNGIELIKRLRGMADFAVMPIIAITAGSEDTKTQAINAGAHMVIEKPINRKDLVKNVNELLLATPFIDR